MAATSIIETDMLKQKILTLTTLCEHHKSKYEQIQVQLRYEFGKKEQQYIAEIKQLQQQITNQKQKLDDIQNKLQEYQQQSNNKDNIHHQNVKELHLEVRHYQNNIEQIKKDYSTETLNATEEIEALNTKLLQKDSQIAELQKQLTKTYEQIIYRGFQSPSTLKVAKSASFSYFEPSEATMLSPVDETSMVLVNNDISPIPSMSVNNHYQIKMKKYNKSRKVKKDNNVSIKHNHIKWSDTMPPPINTFVDESMVKHQHNYNFGTSDEETDDDMIASLNKPPLKPFRSSSLGEIGVTPFGPQQNVNNMRKKEQLTAQDIGDAINYDYQKSELQKGYSHDSSSYESNRKQSSSICFIKNSETQSADVIDTAEGL